MTKETRDAESSEISGSESHELNEDFEAINDSSPIHEILNDTPGTRAFRMTDKDSPRPVLPTTY